MGGGGTFTTEQQQQHYYTTTGGSIDFSNLLGNLNYKGGSISTTNTSSFTQHIEGTQEQSATSKGGSGGTFDVAASVGVGVGGNGSGGQVDKQSSYTGDSDSFGGGVGGGAGKSLSNKTILIGGAVAISGALALALMFKRRK